MRAIFSLVTPVRMKNLRYFSPLCFLHSSCSHGFLENIEDNEEAINSGSEGEEVSFEPLQLVISKQQPRYNEGDGGP